MTRSPMQQGKINKTLDTLTRVNGAEIIPRRALIERCVSEGYRVTVRKNGERVLMSQDGSWFDSKAITKIGIDYALQLAAACDEEEGR